MELIISDAGSLIREGRTSLLLTERKEHAAQLAEAIQGKADHVFLLLGSGKQQEKRNKLAALRQVPARESLVVVATGRYIGEGFDEPRLDTILLAMPISWKGTLAQYAGRLHRSYEGKQEVRIYDYVDIHVPSLERMYHKRLKGYAELGYQVKLAGKDAMTSKIYDGQTYPGPFMEDLSNAAESILIVSPWVRKGRLQMLLPLLEKAVKAGVQVGVRTRPAQEDIALLNGCGIVVEVRSELQQSYAVMDRSIVWYGNINYLAYSSNESNALRFENADIAGEILELEEEGDLPEQLKFT